MNLVNKMSLSEVNQETEEHLDETTDRENVLADKNQLEGDGIRNEEELSATRRRVLTAKGYDYRVTMLREKRQKLYKRLQRKSSTIEELLYSDRNMLTVEQELAQFNDTLKLFADVHEELSPLLESERRLEDDEWFDDFDNQVCTFKRKVHNWLKDVEERRSKGSSKSSRSIKSKSSKCSSKSSKSRSSKSSHEREVEDKVKMAELMAEAEFLEQRQLLQNQAETLKVQQELAKAKARVAAYGQSNLIEDNDTELRINQNQQKLSSKHVKEEKRPEKHPRRTHVEAANYDRWTYTVDDDNMFQKKDTGER